MKYKIAKYTIFLFKERNEFYMFIISKKRIELILSCILISILAFSLNISNKPKTNENIINQTNMENSVETVSTPVSGKTVVIDAGHGTPDEGAESSSRNDRSGNKSKNCIKTTKFIRAKWMHSSFNKVR